MDEIDLIKIETGLLSVACLLCILIILSFILIPVGLYISNKITQKKLQKKLEADFVEKYGFRPYRFNLKKFKNDKVKISYNCFKLGFPRWAFSNKDGTKDKRYTGNHIVAQESTLWLIGDFVLTCENPFLMLKFISFLREKRGVIIQRDHYEEELAQRVIAYKDSCKRYDDIEKLFRRYSTDSYTFEKYCASLFKKEGYITKVTSQTNDGGFDIILQTKDGKKGLVECKCFQPSTSVGRPLIQKLVGANVVEKADFLIFVTTGIYSESALEYAKLANVKCIDGNELIKIHQKNYPFKKEPSSASYEEWKLTGEYLYPLFPPDVYQAYLDEPLKFIHN